MSLRDQLNQIYVPEPRFNDQKLFRTCAEELFQNVSERMIEKAEKGEVEKNNYILGTYILVNINYSIGKGAPVGAPKIQHPFHLIVNNKHDLRKMLRELKRLAFKEGLVFRHNSPNRVIRIMHRVKR